MEEPDGTGLQRFIGIKRAAGVYGRAVSLYEWQKLAGMLQ